MEGRFFSLSGTSGKARCEPNWSWQPAPLPDYDLWYAVKGKGEMRINRVLYDIRPGDCFILHPGDEIRASQHPDDPLTVLYCHFRVSNGHAKIEETSPSPMPEDRCVRIRDTYRMEPLLHQLVDMATNQKSGEEAEFDLLLKLILTRWHREKDKRHEPARHYYVDRLIQQVHNEIRFRLSETIDYEVLAASAGLTSRYVSFLMKRHTGLTLKETISKLRMERAVHLLTETAMTVTEVAEALAYSDIYTFSKLFKRYYGYAPSEARTNRSDAQK
ncbi:AraC family transcriptional regulator [Paenibacillus sp. LHD-117]|uniref:helix-turn-helix transcriptional regulator n=1 Tax=Paenibacillus sp. LHD-117 TaxID=3071412 RepID=UPI0027DFC2B4|nr:AraC family transcriptional regulator [Paenibacillus sp. LHD-117]MDQ6420568.1 AraC family transcriptional regulator [Paenibacillus sp. LHD-117]